MERQTKARKGKGVDWWCRCCMSCWMPWSLLKASKHLTLLPVDVITHNSIIEVGQSVSSVTSKHSSALIQHHPTALQHSSHEQSYAICHQYSLSTKYEIS